MRQLWTDATPQSSLPNLPELVRPDAAPAAAQRDIGLVEHPQDLQGVQDSHTAHSIHV